MNLTREDVLSAYIYTDSEESTFFLSAAQKSIFFPCYMYISKNSRKYLRNVSFNNIFLCKYDFVFLKSNVIVDLTTVSMVYVQTFFQIIWDAPYKMQSNFNAFNIFVFKIHVWLFRAIVDRVNPDVRSGSKWW